MPDHGFGCIVGSVASPVTETRVLHLLPDLALGGGTTIVLHHVRHADRTRYDVRVCSLGGEQTARTMFEDAGTEPIILDLPRDGTAGTIMRLVRTVRRERIDLLHVHGDTDRKLGQIAGFLTGTPVVAQLHSEWVYFGVHQPEGAGPLRRLKGHIAGHGRDRLERRVVVHYAADSARVAARFAPYVEQPITVLRQAVSIEEIDAARARQDDRRLRRELDLSPDARVLISVARLVDGKGHDDLIEMLTVVAARHPEVVLVLVGDGDRRPAVAEAVREAGLDDHVRILGNRVDVPALLTLAEVFVFASSTEGFGIAVLEAMAASLPVVAYRLPAFLEFAVPGVTADLVPVGEVAALAERVNALLADPERARLMGNAAREVIETHFGPESIARDSETVYETAIAQR